MRQSDPQVAAPYAPSHAPLVQQSDLSAPAHPAPHIAPSLPRLDAPQLRFLLQALRDTIPQHNTHPLCLSRGQQYDLQYSSITTLGSISTQSARSVESQMVRHLCQSATPVPKGTTSFVWARDTQQPPPQMDAALGACLQKQAQTLRTHLTLRSRLSFPARH